MSNLEDLYKEILLDHYRSPRCKGTLPTPPAVKQEGFNPFCGDEINLFLDKTDPEKLEVRIEVRGCTISQSSASLMAQEINGKSASYATELIEKFKNMMSVGDLENPEQSQNTEPEKDDFKSMGEIAVLLGVVKFPSRIKCATLAWNTLKLALLDQP
jgi:nitrogen fixation NifU-like protein